MNQAIAARVIIGHREHVLFVHHRKIAGSTSALGQSHRFAFAGRMSVLTPIATEIAIGVHVG
jgi:hypothetical protein